MKIRLIEEFGKDFLNYSISDFGKYIWSTQRCKLLKILSKPIIILDEHLSLDEESIRNLINCLLKNLLNLF